VDLIFILHPQLHYIQGFHDVCSVFLLVCGEEQAFYLCERVALLHLRDTLRSSLDSVLKQLYLIFPLIAKKHPTLFQYLNQSGTQSHFALPWLLTWFSHNIEDLASVARLYDFFLGQHPLVPVYASAAVILSQSDEVFKRDCDMPTIHHFFQNFPPIDVEQIVDITQALMDGSDPTQLLLETKTDFLSDSPLGLKSVKELSFYFAQNCVSSSSLSLPSWEKKPSAVPTILRFEKFGHQFELRFGAIVFIFIIVILLLSLPLFFLQHGLVNLGAK